MNLYDFKKSFIFLITTIFILLITIAIISNTTKFSSSIKSNIKTFFLIDTQFIDLNKGVYYTINEIFKKNYYSFTKLDKISIDINFKDYEKLKKIRAKSINKNYLHSKEYLNAKLSFNNQTFHADVRLDGLFSDHWSLRKQWSLKFKIKENKAIKGYTNFTLSNHFTRQHPFNQIISSINAHHGVLSPRSETFRVKINGEWWGNMLLEEDMSESFLELNKRKVNPIFRFEDIYTQLSLRKRIKRLFNNDNFDLYHQTDLLSKQYFSHLTFNKKKKYSYDTNYHNIISKVKSIFLKIEDSEIINYEVDNLLDVEKFSISLLNVLIFGTSGHGLQYQNIRFYYNIFTNKLEPIPRDHFYIRDLQVRSLINNEEISNFQDTINNLPNIYLKIIKSSKFAKVYDDYLSNFDEFDIILNNYINLHCKSFGQNCINSIDKEIIRKNFNFLKTNQAKKYLLNYSKNEIKYLSLHDKVDNHIEDLLLNDLRLFDNGNIKIKSIFPYNTKIQSIEFYCKIKCHNITTNKKVNINLIIKPFENINTNINNYEKINLELFDTIIVNSKYKNNLIKQEYLIENYLNSSVLFLENNTHLHPYLVKKENNFFVKKGKWIVNEPIIIPKYYSLNIPEETELLFTENSYIFIDKGDININGTKLNNVKLKPANNYWRGIYVIDSKNSKIINTNIEGINNFNALNNLTGSVTFYNSKIILKNVYFNNSISEDMLNIVNSTFHIDSLHFNNVYSDALDIDFSNGKIKRSHFNNVGGDGIDTSGSNVEIENVYMSNVHDKSFSIGEKSNVTIINSNVSNVGVGIVSKDGSNTISKNNIIQNYKLAKYLAYKKKEYYSDGSNLVIFDEINNTKDIYSQKGSSILFNNIKIKNVQINIKKLYESSSMKKNDKKRN